MFYAISADTIRAMFPKLIGDVHGGERVDSETVLVDMGPHAFAVMVGAEMRACCPTESKARAFAKKLADERKAAKRSIVVPQIGAPKV